MSSGSLGFFWEVLDLIREGVCPGVIFVEFRLLFQAFWGSFLGKSIAQILKLNNGNSLSVFCGIF